MCAEWGSDTCVCVCVCACACVYLLGLYPARDVSISVYPVRMFVLAFCGASAGFSLVSLPLLVSVIVLLAVAVAVSLLASLCKYWCQHIVNVCVLLLSVCFVLLSLFVYVALCLCLCLCLCSCSVLVFRLCVDVSPLLGPRYT